MREIQTPPVPAIAPVPPIAAVAPGPDVVSLDQLNDPLHQLDVLQERAMKLELKVADLASKMSQLREERDGLKGQDRAIAQQRYLDVQHDFTAASIELSSVQKKISQLERLVLPQTAAVTVQAPPSRGPELNSEQIMQIIGGGGMLLIPLVLALTWKILRRGRSPQAADIESSPRLQRMEQAIEAIALEVERIGEAQRFSTKLLSERQPEAIANRAAAPAPARVVTPH
jgi:hypothetical protein